MVSIIVTTHNYGHFLAETINSVRGQTFSDWECIVVDRGSTDNTRDIMNDFTAKDGRFKYLFRGDKGVSAARNSGIEISRGEYIQFLDGDDLLQKNKIDEQLKIFSSHPEVDIVYGDVRFFDDGNSGVLRNSKTGNKPDDWLPHLSGSGDVIMDVLKSYNFLVTHSPLVRRSVIERCGVFDERMEALEDWDFWLRCAGKGCYFMFHHAADAMVLVRVHSKSLSRRSDLMLKGNFIMLENEILLQEIKIRYKLFFILKYAELFWDTVFSPLKLPALSPSLVFFAVILFPAWIFLKVVRPIFSRQ